MPTLLFAAAVLLSCAPASGSPDIAKPFSKPSFRIHPFTRHFQSFQLPRYVRQSGLSGDICTSSEQCQGTRICFQISGQPSRCFPLGGRPQPCTVSEDCPAGELCVSLLNGRTGCVSRIVVEGSGIIDPPSPGGTALTGDKCLSSADCEGNRACTQVLGFGDRCLPSNGLLQDCASSEDCPAGELCLTRADASGVCSSREFAEEIGASEVPSRGGTALTGEKCTSSADCKDTRVCASGTRFGRRCAPSSGRLQNCTSTSDCVDSEMCLPTPPNGDAVCISPDFIEELGVRGPPTPGGTKLTLDKCASSAECAESRVCVGDILEAARCISPSTGLQVCSFSDECDNDEICSTVGGQGFCGSQGFAEEVGTTDSSSPQGDTGGTTTPEPTMKPASTTEGPTTEMPPSSTESSTTDDNAVDSPSDESADGSDDGSGLEGEPDDTGSGDNTIDPCIAVHSLTHLSREQLRFEKDILANVLCDESGSCATTGHMIRYHGKAMMMKSYCDIVGGCAKNVMQVNSPRYGFGVTIPSYSENMVFTAFSARYGTRAEEVVLAVAIKVGF